MVPLCSSWLLSTKASLKHWKEEAWDEFNMSGQKELIYSNSRLAAPSLLTPNWKRHPSGAYRKERKSLVGVLLKPKTAVLWFSKNDFILLSDGVDTHFCSRTINMNVVITSWFTISRLLTFLRLYASLRFWWKVLTHWSPYSFWGCVLSLLFPA